MRPLSEREKLIGRICGIVLLGYLFYYAVGRPLQEMRRDLQEKIAFHETLSRKYLKAIEASHRVPKEYSEYWDLFFQKRSDDQEMSGIISEIEAAARRVGLSLSEIQPHKIKKRDSYNIFSISLFMEGELPRLIQFVYLLENRPYLLKIDKLRWERKSIPDSSLHIRMVLTRRLVVQ